MEEEDDRDFDSVGLSSSDVSYRGFYLQLAVVFLLGVAVLVVLFVI